MSETTQPRRKAEAYVSCLSCGATSLQFVEELPLTGLKGTANCPKCNNRAYTNNLRGLWHFMRAVSEEIARLKLDMIDVQSDGEER